MKNNVRRFILAMNHANQIKIVQYLVEHETVIFHSKINAIQFLADSRSIRKSYWRKRSKNQSYHWIQFHSML